MMVPDLNQHRFLRFYFPFFTLVLVSIEMIYQTLKAAFPKHLEVLQKDFSTRLTFVSALLRVWQCSLTRACVFDMR